MKKILSNKITTIILLIVTILSLAFYAYMLARPISYGMNYHNKTVYEGMEFEGNLKFYTDGTIVINNGSFLLTCFWGGLAIVKSIFSIPFKNTWDL